MKQFLYIAAIIVISKIVIGLARNNKTWRCCVMSPLKAIFDELRERIRHGREVGRASFEPIDYLVFSPEQILEASDRRPRGLN